MHVTTTPTSSCVLVLSEYESTCKRLADLLAGEPYELSQATSIQDTLEQLAEGRFSVVVIERSEEDTSDLTDVLAIRAAANSVDAEVVEFAAPLAISATPDRQLAVSVAEACRRRDMRTEISRLRQHVAWNYGFDNVIGISSAMVRVREMARRIAPTDISILISGPSGSGRELLARAIHHHSNRRKGPLVCIDCSALPAEILEQELFGNLGQSGSVSALNAPTLLADADGGTLVLREVDSLENSTQTRLLQFLRDASTALPNGSNRKIDIRLIATANPATEQPEFAELDRDLLQRLGQIRIELPELSQRAEDIEVLSEYFLRHQAAETGRPQLTLTREAVDKLLAHSWPGNVGELENTLRRAATFCESRAIAAVDIKFVGTHELSGVTAEHGSVSLTIKGGLLDSGQRALIAQALTDNNWNFTRTAVELGIGRTTLWRKVKKYKLRKEPVTG